MAEQQLERTLVFIKPDGVERRLVGRILSRFEDKGLRLVGLKMMRVSRELAQTHYAEHRGKPFYDGLVEFVTSGPIVCLCLEGFRAVSVVRQMMGKTFGYEAAPGTIRGDFGISNQFNLIHGSDSPESAAREVELYFRPEELHDYRMPDSRWLAAGS
ncbi:MAG: nucleoside diphosphate kinase [Planctomycetota bacterium]|nr:MAG: nucleoside diphosphate kinase [Planctomycetota bacterium]